MVVSWLSVGCLIVGVVCPNLILAQERVKPEPEQGAGLKLVDHDGDGWDDEWVRLYAEIDVLAPFDDANGDGVPNLFEMFLKRDPFAVPVKQRARQPFEIAREKQRVKERRELSYEERREMLKPFLNEGLRDSEGRPITRKQWLGEQRKGLAAVGKDLRSKSAERKARVETYLKTHGADLPASLRDSLQDVEDGQPRFVQYFGE